MRPRTGAQWVRDPIPDLEALAFAEPALPQLPSRGPTLGRPTIRAHFGIIPETDLGTFESAERKRLEAGLVQALLVQHTGHIIAADQVRTGQDGTPTSQWDFLFDTTDAAVATRQGLRDAGGVNLTVPGRPTPVWLSVRDGPGRLPSSLVRIVVSNLPADFMVPGVIRSLLASAGYPFDEHGVIVRAEHGGEHKAEIAAIAPNVMRMGVVVGVVKPPAGDRMLLRLPRTLQDVDRAIHISVVGSQPVVATPPPPSLARPEPVLQGFVRAIGRPGPPQVAVSHHLARALDPVVDLGAHIAGDRRGLGHFPPPPRGPIPAHARTDAREMPLDMDVEYPDQPPLPAPPSGGTDSAPLPEAGPMPRVVASASRQPLPDVPLTETTMEWLAEYEDPPRSVQERQDHVARLIVDYPAVWAQYSHDTSRCPAPEVRTALRDIGGVDAWTDVSTPTPRSPRSEAAAETPPPQVTTTATGPTATPPPPQAASARGRTGPCRRPGPQPSVSQGPGPDIPGPAQAARRRHSSRQQAQLAWHDPARLPTSQPPPGFPQRRSS